jgi:hypothetical protein
MLQQGLFRAVVTTNRGKLYSKIDRRATLECLMKCKCPSAYVKGLKVNLRANYWDPKDDTIDLQVEYYNLKSGFCKPHFIQKHYHQQMHKESIIINCNTLLHVSTLLGHLQGELSVIVTLRLHFIVE